MVMSWYWKHNYTFPHTDEHDPLVMDIHRLHEIRARGRPDTAGLEKEYALGVLKAKFVGNREDDCNAWMARTGHAFECRKMEWDVKFVERDDG